MDYSYEVEGVEEVSVKARAIAEGVGRQLRDIVEQTARFMAEEMRQNAPVDQGALRDSIDVDTGYAPGGAGGGGTYEARVTVGEGIPYFRYVVEGTGEKVGHDPIVAASGRVMPMQYEGKTLAFGAYSTGQDPQSQWITDAQELGRRYIEARVDALDIER
jgi:hypothetical protein